MGRLSIKTFYKFILGNEPNISTNEINSSKEYSFEEYVNLLLNNNKSKSYPDINNIPD